MEKKCIFGYPWSSKMLNCQLCGAVLPWSKLMVLHSYNPTLHRIRISLTLLWRKCVLGTATEFRSKYLLLVFFFVFLVFLLTALLGTFDTCIACAFCCSNSFKTFSPLCNLLYLLLCQGTNIHVFWFLSSLFLFTCSRFSFYLALLFFFYLFAKYLLFPLNLSSFSELPRNMQTVSLAHYKSAYEIDLCKAKELTVLPDSRPPDR